MGYDDSALMRYLFLPHSVSHQVVAVDLSAVDLRTNTADTFSTKNVPVALFRSWMMAKAHFRFLGADDASLDRAHRVL